MTQVRAQVHEETNKAQLPWANTNLTAAVYLNPVAAPAATVAAANTPPSTASAASEVELEFWRSVKDSEQGGRTQCLSDQLPHGSIQIDRLGAARRAGERPGHDHPQPVGAARSDGRNRRSNPGNRGPDRPRQAKTPRRAAPADPSRLRHQGQRKVRRGDPRCHQALAGGTRLSQRPASSTRRSIRPC